MKKSIKITAGLTAAVLAVSMMGFGFARWSSEVKLDGNISASGKWDVEITDASLTASETGASITPIYTEPEGGYKLYYPGSKVTDYSLYNLGNAVSAVKIDKTKELGEKLDTLICDRTSSNGKRNVRPWLFAIDTTKWTWADIKSTNGKDNFNAIKYDESSVNLDTVTYLYNLNSYSTSDAKKVGQMYLDDVTALLKEKYPDTYQNYMVVKLFSDKTGMGASADLVAYMTSPDENTAVFTESTVTYADVAFTISDAWANYSVTVTNNGTVNANLSDYSFDFTALDSEIFTVEQPTGFDSEVLKPGESCTFSFVVKANGDADSDELSAESTSFTVTLNYVQDTVEEAPAAGHSHS